MFGRRRQQRSAGGSSSGVEGRSSTEEADLRHRAEQGDPEAISQLAVLLVQSERFGDAATWFDRMADDGDPERAFSAGFVHWKAGHVADAERRLRPAARAGHGQAALVLGSLLQQSGRMEEGTEWLMRGAKLGAMKNAKLVEVVDGNPTTQNLARSAADAAYEQAAKLVDQGDLDGAERFLRGAAEAGHVEAMTNLGVLSYRKGNWAEAESLWMDAANRGHAEAAFNLGTADLKAQRPVDAERWLLRAAEGGYGEAMNNLGTLLREQGREAEGQVWLRKGASAGNTHAARNLAVIYLQSGRNAEAEPLLRQAVAAGDLDSSVNLGILLVDTGRSAEAEAVWRTAAEAGADAAARNLAVLLTGQGRVDEAERWRRRG